MTRAEVVFNLLFLSQRHVSVLIDLFLARLVVQLALLVDVRLAFGSVQRGCFLSFLLLKSIQIRANMKSRLAAGLLLLVQRDLVIELLEK